MLQKYQLTFGLAFCLLLIQPITGFAVEEFKVSKNGKGEQIWFEAEAFDERDPAEAYKLGKGEKAVDPADGAFGDIVTNAVAKVGYSIGSTSVVRGAKPGNGGLLDGSLIRAITQIGCGSWGTMVMRSQR